MNFNFDIEYWAAKGGYTQEVSKAAEKAASVEQGYRFQTDWTSSHEDVERLIRKIEETKADITADYGNWIKCGFAIASEFGEAGREYFHRISQYYPNYSYQECDKKYNSCLRGNGCVTIKSLFHIAKENGVLIYSI